MTGSLVINRNIILAAACIRTSQHTRSGWDVKAPAKNPVPVANRDIVLTHSVLLVRKLFVIKLSQIEGTLDLFSEAQNVKVQIIRGFPM